MNSETARRDEPGLDSQPSAPAMNPVTNLLLARTAGFPVWVLITQVFIGLGWLRAAVEKLIDPEWWQGRVIEQFVAANADHTLGWYQPILDLVVLPNTIAIALVVLGLQAIVGLLMLLGRSPRLALAAAMFMNLNFLAIGAVNPSAFYLLAQGAVALWLVERNRRIEPNTLQWAAVAAISLASFSLPFVSTVHPAAVIDDPAIMMITFASLTVLACDLVHRRQHHGHGLP